MIENRVVDHYSGGALGQRVFAAIRDQSTDPLHPTLDELAGIDEFHLGGRPATAILGEHLELRAGQRVLDIGSGLGGPARYLADRYRVSVTGIDLTPEFVELARSLTGLVGLTNRVSFRVGSATALPFPDRSFERAYLIHVGMNIEDKAALFAEAHRVLVPSGRLLVYDVMRAGPGALTFPLPWASAADVSSVAEPAEYAKLLAQAGFSRIEPTSWRDVALKSFDPNGPGRPIVMGADGETKIANLKQAVLAGLVEPTEIVAWS
jgi:ubiquinone/menaquinone biosynthesis C-methylase UbiE